MLSTDEKRRKFEAANFFKLGHSYVMRDFLDKAEVAFQKTVKLDPEHALAWAYLCKIHEKHGRKNEAEEYYKKALLLDKGIDFKKITYECRLLEDKQAMTNMMLQYKDGKMTTADFMSYVESIPARSIALIGNDSAGRHFFRRAVDKAVTERILAFEFRGLASFLSPLNIPFERIVLTLEMNLVPMFLTTNSVEDFCEFIDFIRTKISKTEEERALQGRLEFWHTLSVKFKPFADTTNDSFERAVSLFNIVETQKKAEGKQASFIPLLNEIVTFIITSVAEEGKKGTNRLLSAFNAPIPRVIEILEDNLVAAFLTSKNRQQVIDLMVSLQSEMVRRKRAKKHIARADNWLDLLNRLQVAMEKSSDEFDQIVNLLDVIVDTKAKFQPMVIAEQSLRMIERDLSRIERFDIFLLRVLHWDLFESKRVDKRVIRKWLAAIKRAYFKLQLMSKNHELKLNESERVRLREIAESMLIFSIASRTSDLIEKMAMSGMRNLNVIDVFLPEEYLSFSIPAFRVMDDFLKNPLGLALMIEHRNPQMKFDLGFWSLSLTITLTQLPPVLFVDSHYVDFIVPEYLKTLALAMKVNLPVLSRIHRLANMSIKPQDIMIRIFKGLSDHSAVQLTREQVIEALRYGGWDISLCDLIIKEEKYCIYCSYALPKDATQCPNCDRPVEDIDLSDLTIDDVDL
ncbi:MAG: hypothetical protein EAX87_00005 [Candidatus Thorarchaeota archaeon]|nr:hypothetical protein [Candidatus Thorarchaeota archaeon]